MAKFLEKRVVRGKINTLQPPPDGEPNNEPYTACTDNIEYRIFGLVIYTQTIIVLEYLEVDSVDKGIYYPVSRTAGSLSLGGGCR
jgi:hypothetical protein